LIFARQFSREGAPVGRRFYDFDGWSNGATVYRGRELPGTYDDQGNVIPEALCEALQIFPPGAYVSFDIEELGYNVLPRTGQNQQQIDYILAAKQCRPDLKYGYFSTFGQTINALRLPPGGEVRQTLLDVLSEGFDLAEVVDFIAPAAYVLYHGQITNADGSGANGVPGFITDFWPPNQFYGFEEWAEYISFLINSLRVYNRPIFPYVAPYTILNNAAGDYHVGLSNDDLFEIPYFDQMVEHVLSISEGLFFFDLASSQYSPEYQEIIASTLLSHIII